MLMTLIKIRLQGILLRQTKSSKKKGNSIGKLILFGLLFAYVGVVFIGMFGMLFYSLIEPFSMMGIEWLYFALMALFIILLCFIGSIFLTHHEIYEAKDNELLLAMPIKNSDILRVFERGFSGYNGRLTQQSSGLGLYLSKKIADQLGHEISISSQVGQGTTVSIHFQKQKLAIDY